MNIQTEYRLYNYILSTITLNNESFRKIVEFDRVSIVVLSIQVD